MSYYSCIDLIDNALTDSKSRNFSLFQKIRFYFLGKPTPLSQEDKAVLCELRHKLSQRIHENNYTDLNLDITNIREYFDKTESNNECLKSIVDDLKEMKEKYQARFNSSTSNHSEQYKKFQAPKYRIADIRQGRSYKLGNSGGECYGFTHAMVDATISPYKNPIDTVDLNERIHQYQRAQNSRTLDQDRIKRTRLTREHFCPDFNRQAKALLSIATRYQGKELSVHKRDSIGAHACYLSKQDDGKIRYMDPNHGAYLFDNPNDFIEFYVVVSETDKQTFFDGRFYSLSQLTWDPERTLTESKSFMGKIRTFLTGPKYGDMTGASITGAIVALVGICLGLFLGAAIGSIVPIIGTTAGAYVGELFMAFGVNFLLYRASATGNFGLLAIIHYVRDSWHNFMQKTDGPSSTTASHHKTASNRNSTIGILSSLDAPEPKKENEVDVCTQSAVSNPIKVERDIEPDSAVNDVVASSTVDEGEAYSRIITSVFANRR